MLLADVILPLPLSGVFTYIVPPIFEELLDVGYRVIVPFGAKKYYTAIVAKIHTDLSKSVEFKLKEINSIIDNTSFIKTHQLKFWQWISFYNICPLGTIYDIALPNYFKITSETVAYLKYPNNKVDNNLTGNEKLIFSVLYNLKKAEKISKIASIISKQNILPNIYSLIKKDIISIDEVLTEKYIPPTDTYIEINNHIDNPIEKTKKGSKQQEVYKLILSILQKNNALSILQKDLIDKYNCSYSTIKSLINKGLLEKTKKDKKQLETNNTFIEYDIVKHNNHNDIVDSITKSFDKYKTSLLKGTKVKERLSIYIDLIKRLLNREEQALIIFPEISFLMEIKEIIASVFPKEVAFYFNENTISEQNYMWSKMLSDNPYKIILGINSCLFLPYKNLKLIIIEEEHSNYYKQESYPYINIKNTALVLANILNTKSLLVSNTPSIETQYKADGDKFGLININYNYNDKLSISIENTKELRRRKKMKGYLSPILIEQINKNLQIGKQSILLCNRKGFAPALSCKNCDWVPKCNRCGVSLTYYKKTDKLICNCCNKSYNVVKKCPHCNEEKIEDIGLGIEKLEEDINNTFPLCRYQILDSDIVRKKSVFNEITSKFNKNKLDILIGTTSILRLKNFNNTSTIGVINADDFFSYPNFKSYEKGFQLMMSIFEKVEKDTNIIIQCVDSESKLFEYISTQNYTDFYKNQLSERYIFKYPPFVRLIYITLYHKSESIVDAAAYMYADNMKEILGEMLIGPIKPLIAKVKYLYTRQIILKLNIEFSQNKIREDIKRIEDYIKPKFQSIKISYNVDP